jgi:thioredoxin reductase
MRKISSYNVTLIVASMLWTIPFPDTVAYNPSTHFQQTTTHQSIDKKEDISTISWLIVGGGIHGVHIATRLLASEHAQPSSLRIIDDNEFLLHSWKSRTANTGMEYLRSSAGYHLDVDENSLRRHFRKEKKSVFAKDYERPRLDIFNQHCDSVIQKYGLNELHQPGKVVAIEPKDDHVQVRVSLNEDDSSKLYKADNVVLALGNDDPSYAEWVDVKDIEERLVCHLLDEKQNKDSTFDVNEQKNIAVIGGGITAAHKALELAKKSSKETNIHLISRHPLKEQQFDTHQDWMMDRAASKRSEESGGAGMPKRQRMFATEASLGVRRKIIAKERVPGTVTPALNRGENGLRYMIENGNIQWHQAGVLQSERSDTEKCMKLSLSSGKRIEVDQVLLATGFGKRLPGGKLVKDLVEHHGLPVSDGCGYPIVDESLSWHPRIFVAGALAELELGPSARNIAGARLAAERLCHR